MKDGRGWVNYYGLRLQTGAVHQKKCVYGNLHEKNKLTKTWQMLL
jgi:hypothetical protein